MWRASNAYMATLNDDRVIRDAVSRIVVDGVEYTGRTHLKTFPRIEHATSSMIGGFPAKTCTFEIWKQGDDIDLHGKEVHVYRGLRLPSGIEWVPLGIFSADDEDISTSSTGNYITFKGRDRTRLLEQPWGDVQLNYPFTASREFVRTLARHCGVPFPADTTSIPNTGRQITHQPNAPASMTCREMIGRYAEIVGGIAQINRLGQLVVSRPFNTGITISRARYEKVYIEPEWPAITAISLGAYGFDDDIIAPPNAGDSDIWWRLEDNPIVWHNRQAWSTHVLNNLRGRSIIPFDLRGVIDNFIFDINDTIDIRERDGSIARSTILQISTSNRMRSNFKTETQHGGKVRHELAGSVREASRRVALQVDHVRGEIDMLAEDLRATGQSLTSQINMQGGRITMLASDLAATGQSLTSQISLTADGVELLRSALDASDALREEWVRFVGSHMSLGRSDSPMEVRISNERIYFTENGFAVAYITGNRLFIQDAEISGNLQIGNFIWKGRPNGAMTLFRI
ncbi:MAG: hypothetical protein FWE40_05490 [Oscillospiraceae bacterium]|nr:hypothetical protein [Oscillospiraceae bacterium]